MRAAEYPNLRYYYEHSYQTARWTNILSGLLAPAGLGLMLYYHWGTEEVKAYLVMATLAYLSYRFVPRAMWDLRVSIDPEAGWKTLTRYLTSRLTAAEIDQLENELGSEAIDIGHVLVTQHWMLVEERVHVAEVERLADIELLNVDIRRKGKFSTKEVLEAHMRDGKSYDLAEEDAVVKAIWELTRFRPDLLLVDGDERRTLREALAPDPVAGGS